jgi:aminomethyltransferase
MTIPHSERMVLETPFHARVAAACEANEWYRWKAYTCVNCYTEVELEYFALRNSAGVFDLSPMSKYRIRGPQARDYLDRLVTRDLGRLAPGRVAYCVWCDDAGQVLDDGTLFSLRENEYRLCAADRHLDWLRWSAIGFEVEISEETGAVAALAVQGPTSCAILKRMGLAGVEQLKPFALAHFPFAGGELMVSRTGFTGDLGYELWIAPERALELWDALMAAGRDRGIRPIGARALEVARIEAGFIQAGVDFLPAHHGVRPGRSRSPFELGLGWLVDFAKPVFNGRRALLAERDSGSRHHLARLDVEGNKPARDSFIYGRGRRPIGTVTSAVWSPTAKANIALASVRAPYGRAGETLWAEIYYNRELEWTRTRARCRVVEGPFFNPARRRATPPPEF